jgi:hypothetical protein
MVTLISLGVGEVQVRCRGPTHPSSLADSKPASADSAASREMLTRLQATSAWGQPMPPPIEKWL